MTPLFLLDPPDARAAWSPFSGVRPIAELRAGVPRLRERWEAALALTTTAILSDACAGFVEIDAPPVVAMREIDGPAVIAAAWFAIAGPFTPAAATRRLTSSGETVAWIVPAGERWQGPADTGAAEEVPGLALRGTSDLLTALDTMLTSDCLRLASTAGAPLPDGTIVFGERKMVAAWGAEIEPGVVFDARKGAVVLESGVEIRHGTRIEGPCYVGAGSRVLGGFIRGSVFGPRCVVHGEIAASSFLGYVNKSHDGFVGNSVLGHWVNLGAGTTTSNLKNTYGLVRLDVGGQVIETGRLNVGCLIGDHAKTAIGSMLNTGTVVGAGASVFGSAGIPKYVPPFAWGTATAERMTEAGFLRIAERVMPRRDVELSAERRQSLGATYRRMTGSQ